MAEEKKQEQQKVEIVEERCVNETSKWSFLKYVKGIAKFKWWVIGFTLFGGLAGFLGFHFILNPAKKTLSAVYTYNLAGEYIDSDTFRFIDGTLFNPYDLTGKENLQKVKENNEKYAGINIDKIVSDNVISVAKNVTYYNENDSSSISVNYTMQAKAKYFPSEAIGKEFLYDLINYGKELSTIAISNFKAELKFAESFDKLTFDRQISQLFEQYVYIGELYNSLINNFSSTANSGIGEKTVYEAFNDYNSQYYLSGVSSFTAVLTGQKDSNKFVNYVVGQEDETIEDIHKLCHSYIETIKNNDKTIDVYEDRLNKLLNSPSIIGTDTNVSAKITEYDKLIAELELENSNIEKELKNNGYTLDGSGEYHFDGSNTDTTIYKLTEKDPTWVEENKEFAELIAEYQDSLIKSNSTITKIYQHCYSQYQNKVSIQNGGYVNLSGGMSNFIGAGVGLVVGFAISSLITAIIYVYKED